MASTPRLRQLARGGKGAHGIALPLGPSGNSALGARAAPTYQKGTQRQSGHLRHRAGDHFGLIETATETTQPGERHRCDHIDRGQGLRMTFSQLAAELPTEIIEATKLQRLDHGVEGRCITPSPEQPPVGSALVLAGRANGENFRAARSTIPANLGRCRLEPLPTAFTEPERRTPTFGNGMARQTPGRQDKMQQALAPATGDARGPGSV